MLFNIVCCCSSSLRNWFFRFVPRVRVDANFYFLIILYYLRKKYKIIC